MLNVITNGFAQQFKIFGLFCQHQYLPAFLTCVQNILGDTPVAAGVVGKDAEDILNAGLWRNLWSEQMVRYYGCYSNVSRGKRQMAGSDDAVPCILEPERDEKASVGIGRV